jgi:hypothetical protein
VPDSPLESQHQRTGTRHRVDLHAELLTADRRARHPHVAIIVVVVEFGDLLDLAAIDLRYGPLAGARATACICATSSPNRASSPSTLMARH